MEASRKSYPRCWVFDQNRRCYRKDENGRSYGSPIWREYWREVTIVGETNRSWITNTGWKISKKGGKGIVFSEEELEALAYVNENAVNISDKVLRLQDANLLKQIAELIGYKPE